MQALAKHCLVFKDWLFQDSHKQKADALLAFIGRAFTTHPRETGETYLTHLWFTLKMVARMVFTSAVLVVHGLLPFLFTRTASAQMERIWLIMRSRIPEARREEIKQRRRV